MSIKCRPLNLDTRGLLLGDAAHAMVPFFGQGMNCGFEDCLLLDEIIDELGGDRVDLGAAFPRFTQRRNDDCHVICDLAMYNYIEMRHLVNSPLFLLRKKVDALLNWLLPSKWVPLYGMVTFSRTPYSRVVELRQRQDRVLRWLLAGVVTTVGAALANKLLLVYFSTTSSA